MISERDWSGATGVEPALPGSLPGILPLDHARDWKSKGEVTSGYSYTFRYRPRGTEVTKTDKQTMAIAAGLEPGICGLKARHADLCTTRSNRHRIESGMVTTISGERPRAAESRLGEGFGRIQENPSGPKPPPSRCTTLAPRSQTKASPLMSRSLSERSDGMSKIHSERG